MTEDDAESIIMSVEVGLFRGAPSEVAHALLVIANREEEEGDDDEGRVRAETV